MVPPPWDKPSPAVVALYPYLVLNIVAPELDGAADCQTEHPSRAQRSITSKEAGQGPPANIPSLTTTTVDAEAPELSGSEPIAQSNPADELSRRSSQQIHTTATEKFSGTTSDSDQDLAPANPSVRAHQRRYFSPRELQELMAITYRLSSGKLSSQAIAASKEDRGRSGSASRMHQKQNQCRSSGEEEESEDDGNDNNEQSGIQGSGQKLRSSADSGSSPNPSPPASSSNEGSYWMTHDSEPKSATDPFGTEDLGDIQSVGGKEISARTANKQQRTKERTFR